MNKTVIKIILRFLKNLRYVIQGRMTKKINLSGFDFRHFIRTFADQFVNRHKFTLKKWLEFVK